MQFTKVGSAVFVGVAVMGLWLSLANTGRGQCASCAAPAVVAPAPVYAVAPVPVRVNRIMWTPSYGIASTCNPYVPQTCGYGAAFASPGTGWGCGYAPCTTYMAAAPVATTTYRPFLYRLFHPFTPLVPTTTYRAAFWAPVAPCGGPACGSCAPACGSCTPSMAMYAPACSTCPIAGCAPACNSCVGGASYGPAVSDCAGGNCAPVTTETPTPAPAYDQPGPAAQAPALPQGNNGSGVAPRTYRDEPVPSSQPDVRLKPAVEPTPAPAGNNSSTGIKAPRLIDPVTSNSASPIRQATYVKPVTRSASRPVENKPSKPAIPDDLDFGGWQASSN